MFPGLVYEESLPNRRLAIDQIDDFTWNGTMRHGKCGDSQRRESRSGVEVGGSFAGFIVGVLVHKPADDRQSDSKCIVKKAQAVTYPKRRRFMKPLRSVCGVFAALTILCIAAGQDEDEAKQDLDNMQGGWQIVSSQVADEKAAEDEVKKRTFTVKGDMLTYEPGNELKEKRVGTIKLDPKTKAFDWTLTDFGATMLAIYELQGDDLKIGFGNDGLIRPKRFEIGKENVVWMLVLKRLATVQEGEKRTIKRLTMFLIDAKTKGIAEQTETTGTGIKQIEIPEGTVAKEILLDSADTPKGKEWVRTSVKMTLADETVMEVQILLAKETGQVTLQKVRNGGPRFVSDKGTRTWYVFYAEYDVSADSSKENIAQAKKDMEGLQGTWRRDKMIKVVVKGDKMSNIDTRPGQEETMTGTITLDPKTKAVDWAVTTGLGGGFTRMGTYELKGDDLRILFGHGLDGRATTLDGKADGMDGWLLVLKREKP